MDQRGVPIVNRSIYETPKRNNGIFRRTSFKRSSPFSFRQDISLLEAYDQFSDACFQSNLRSPNLKSPSSLELNLRQLHLTSQRDLPHRSGEYRRRRDDREINRILQAFPKLANYYKLLTRVGQGK
jgi:hypothetical protein